MGVNNIVLLGNLGSDPKVTIFDDKDKMVTLSLATDSSWIDRQTGLKKEATEWHTVQLRRGLAGVAEKYLKKGDKIYVSGSIRNRKYLNDKGQSQYITEIFGKKLLMIPGSVSKARLEELDISSKLVDVDKNVDEVKKPVKSDSKEDDNLVKVPTSAVIDEVALDAHQEGVVDVTADHMEPVISELGDMADQADSEALNPTIDMHTKKELLADDSSEFESSQSIDIEAVEVTSDEGVDLGSAIKQGHAEMDFADSDINLLADEFNREALEAQKRDDYLDIDEDLPDWLLP